MYWERGRVEKGMYTNLEGNCLKTATTRGYYTYKVQNNITQNVLWKTGSVLISRFCFWILLRDGHLKSSLFTNGSLLNSGCKIF